MPFATVLGFGSRIADWLGVFHRLLAQCGLKIVKLRLGNRAETPFPTSGNICYDSRAPMDQDRPSGSNAPGLG